MLPYLRQEAVRAGWMLSSTVPHSSDAPVMLLTSQDSCLLVDGEGEASVASIIRYKEAVFYCLAVVVLPVQ